MTSLWQTVFKEGQYKRLGVDVGCGDHKRKTEADVFWLGLDKADFSDLYPRGEFLQWDLADALPFPDNSVNIIWCHHVFEHLPPRHPRVDMDFVVFVMNEFYRVLTPDGEAHIIVPWKEHTNAWRSPSHYRFMDENYFTWFTSCDRMRGEHRAHGLKGVWRSRFSRIQDECHVYALLLPVKEYRWTSPV